MSRAFGSFLQLPTHVFSLELCVDALEELMRYLSRVVEGADVVGAGHGVFKIIIVCSIKDTVYIVTP